MSDVPVGEQFVFAVRDPIERFVSGFNSRSRKGRPRYDEQWLPREAAAFARYSTPSALAEALGREEGAEKAYRSIRHVSSSYWDWLDDEQSFLARSSDVLMVLRQGRLEEDFERLCNVLGIAATLTSDPVGRHETPANFKTTLTPAAVQNLRPFLAREYDFLDLLESLDL
ncbi:MAG: hypothetical protein P8J50_02735 [Acidimicrobiales bacterium]|nr:hypothetical protein [Acidimicrobiales bacterium]